MSSLENEDCIPGAAKAFSCATSVEFELSLGSQHDDIRESTDSTDPWNDPSSLGASMRSFCSSLSGVWCRRGVTLVLVLVLVAVLSLVFVLCGEDEVVAVAPLSSEEELRGGNDSCGEDNLACGGGKVLKEHRLSASWLSEGLAQGENAAAHPSSKAFATGDIISSKTDESPLA